MDKKQNSDNAGFTFIELIIAVVILALAISPILHAFINSANINGRSRQVLRATTAGQNLMEEIKAGTMDELIGASSEAVEIQVVNEHNYKLTYKNREVDGQKYDITATLNAQEYSSVTGGAAVPGAALGYNDMSQPQIAMMNEDYDGAYMPKAGIAERMAQKIADTPGIAQSWDVIYKQMKKTTTIEVKDASHASIQISYEYAGVTPPVTVTEKSAQLYGGKEGQNGLRTLYVFFEPMYTSSGGIAKENIVIKNPELAPVKVMLVEQRNTSDADYTLNEQNYRVSVQVQEGTRYYGGGTYTPVTRLWTNLSDKQLQLSCTGLMGSALTFAQQVGLEYDITGSVVEDRLYKVEVKVYDKQGEELVTIDGTKETE